MAVFGQEDDAITAPTESGRQTEHELEQPTNLSEDDRRELLQSDLQRLVLDVLSGVSSPVTLDELAQTVAARGDRQETTDLDDEQFLEVTLHHEHLPKMDALSVLHYDSDEKYIVA